MQLKQQLCLGSGRVWAAVCESMLERSECLLHSGAMCPASGMLPSLRLGSLCCALRESTVWLGFAAIHTVKKVVFRTATWAQKQPLPLPRNESSAWRAGRIPDHPYHPELAAQRDVVALGSSCRWSSIWDPDKRLA